MPTPLCDEPIRCFLRRFCPKAKKLNDIEPYGSYRTATINGTDYSVIALAHPRQTAKQGRSSERGTRSISSG